MFSFLTILDWSSLSDAPKHPEQPLSPLISLVSISSVPSIQNILPGIQEKRSTEKKLSNHGHICHGKKERKAICYLLLKIGL
jgi:hypothetical protein